MKLTVLIFTFLIFLTPVFSQKQVVNVYPGLDKVALQLPDSLTKTTDDISGYINMHFITDLEKTRAAFIWIVTKIQFDIDNMYAINFYEKKEDKRRKTEDRR